MFIEYETADYQFVLKDISVCQMAIHGTFLRTGRDVLIVKGSPTVVIQIGDRELSLLLPEQGTALSGAPAGDASTYPSLKDVKLGQEVDVRYHKESGALWMDEISAAAKK